MSTRTTAPDRRALAMGVALLVCSLAAATDADAAIVDMDLGPSGFNVLGPNAGIASGGFRGVLNFPVAGGKLEAYAGYDGYKGLDGDQFLQFAITGGNASPRNFAAGATIDGSATWSGVSRSTCFQFGANVSANFGLGSFMAFRVSSDSGTSWNYGWLQVTWDGTDWEILTGSYESTAGVTIQAGATAGGGGGVPLPGAAGLAACGLLGLGRRRRR